MKIKQILEYGTQKLKQNNVEESRIKARMLLENILSKPRQYLIANDDEELDVQFEKQYYEGIEKLLENVPIEYITNKKEFMNLNFYVDENVLIPRQDTEILVEEVIEIAKKILKDVDYKEEKNSNANEKENSVVKIMDMCTGSGAISVSIAKSVTESQIDAVDISRNALEIVMKNAKKNNVENQIRVVESDLFEKVEKENYDILVSNPPYIRADVLRLLDKQVQKEPEIALNGGKDGLDFYKIIVKKAPQYLKNGGYLCFEIGYDQKDEVEELLRKENVYTEIYSKKDLCGNDRIVIARLKSR